VIPVTEKLGPTEVGSRWLVVGVRMAEDLTLSIFGEQRDMYLIQTDQMLPVYIYGKMTGGFSPTAPALSATVYILSAAALFIPFWFLTKASN
jgi:ABC-type spermidine/putrescine transport system permease subunit II